MIMHNNKIPLPLTGLFLIALLFIALAAVLSNSSEPFAFEQIIPLGGSRDNTVTAPALSGQEAFSSITGSWHDSPGSLGKGRDNISSESPYTDFQQIIGSWRE
jgi:hypothetical protein